MDKYLLYTINRYFDTLAAVGRIDKNEKYALIVAIGIYNFFKMFENEMDPADVEKPLMTEEDKNKFNAYLHCIAHSNTCLFQKFMPQLVCA